MGGLTVQVGFSALPQTLISIFTLFIVPTTPLVKVFQEYRVFSKPDILKRVTKHKFLMN
ncbi:hypothetical protein KKH3_09390 [Pectobacterium actinidiae]|nr:hypothetical protein KKH3_09390 [Pectobacterium actinidiae]